jgi:hypothetical protein
MANLRIAELDFDTIKSNLKEFLKNYTAEDGAPYFTDFDFEGSGISILLDVLSYNTHYNAYLASMVINDMFLDSAVKRASVVSIAKHLGYTPVSTKSARAEINFVVTNPTNSPAFLTLDKFTPFTTTVNDTVLTFVNLDAVTIQPNQGTYTFNNIELVEGVPLEYIFSVDIPGPAEKYVIPNDNIDTSTLQIVVQNSISDTTQTVYTLAEDVIGITGTDNVYFIEETTTGVYQIYFGDGIIGKKLDRNNLVIASYLVSNGTVGNVSGNITQLFTCSTVIGGGTVTGSILATNNSRGGLFKETIDSIKFRAPKFLSSQNRAVSAADYKSLIERNYPLVESVAVWGGEENNPPMYGKVIISLKPYDGYEITQSTKDDIKNIVLQNKQVLSIFPEFITPDYFYINLTVNVKYDSAKTLLSSTDISNLVITEIQNYFATDLQKFDNDFIYSKLSRNIDNSNDIIIGNLMTVKLQRRIEPPINIDNIYTGENTIKFKNGIEPGSIDSTRFIVAVSGNAIECILKDIPNDIVPNRIGTGKIKLVNADNGAIIIENYGTVNYGAGEISIENLNFLGYPADGTDIRLTATVQDTSLDVAVDKNQIILLDDSTLNYTLNRFSGLTVNAIAI